MIVTEKVEKVKEITKTQHSDGLIHAYPSLMAIRQSYPDNVFILFFIQFNGKKRKTTED